MTDTNQLTESGTPPHPSLTNQAVSTTTIALLPSNTTDFRKRHRSEGTTQIPPSPNKPLAKKSRSNLVCGTSPTDRSQNDRSLLPQSSASTDLSNPDTLKKQQSDFEELRSFPSFSTTLTTSTNTQVCQNLSLNADSNSNLHLSSDTCPLRPKNLDKLHSFSQNGDPTRPTTQASSVFTFATTTPHVMNTTADSHTSLSATPISAPPTQEVPTPDRNTNTVSNNSTGANSSPLTDILDLFATQSSFSSHLDDISAQFTSKSTSTLSTPPNITTDVINIDTLVKEFWSNLQVSQQPPTTNTSPAAIAVHQAAQPQPAPSNNTITTPLQVPRPPAPPIILGDNFPTTDVSLIVRPTLPDGLESPFVFKDSTIQSVCAPMNSDLSKSIKAQRRADYLRDCLARDNLPRWAFGIEPIPEHFIPNESTKQKLINLIKQNAISITSIVADGLQETANLNRNDFTKRLEIAQTSSDVSQQEKSATLQLTSWWTNLATAHINNTLHKQWDFLSRNPATNTNIQNAWFPNNSNTRTSSNNNTQPRVPVPTTNHQQRRRSRSPINRAPAPRRGQRPDNTSSSSTRPRPSTSSHVPPTLPSRAPPSTRGGRGGHRINNSRQPHSRSIDFAKFDDYLALYMHWQQQQEQQQN